MNPIKNYFRLPAIYFPLTIIFILLIVLNMVCQGLQSACEIAREEILEQYDHVIIDITRKEKYERIWDADAQKFVLSDINSRKLDNDIIDRLSHIAEAESIQYYTNPLIVPVGYMVSDREISDINASIARGNSFDHNYIRYWADGDPAYDVEFIGSTAGINWQEILGSAETEFVVFDKQISDNSIILPYEIYEMFGQPESINAGWYTKRAVGVSLSINNGQYELPSLAMNAVRTELKMSPPPAIEMSVAGYYKSSKNQYYILCSISAIENLYKLCRYYDNESDDYTYIDSYGAQKISVTTREIEKTDDTIYSMISVGVDPEHYHIMADDYNYKFTVMQINGVNSFIRILTIVSVVMSVVIAGLLVNFAVKKRSGTIYTLKTLGQSNPKIMSLLCGELFCSAVFSCGLGVVLSWMIGTIITYCLNIYITNRAMEAANRLSDIFHFMKDNIALKAQLENAANAYHELGLSLNFCLRPENANMIMLVLICGCIYSCLVIYKYCKTSLMNKG